MTDSCHTYLAPGTTWNGDGKCGAAQSYPSHGAPVTGHVHTWANNKQWIKKKKKTLRSGCCFSFLFFLPQCYPLTPPCRMSANPQKSLLWLATGPYPISPALKPHEGVVPAGDREAIYFRCISSDWLMCWLENWLHASKRDQRSIGYQSIAFRGLFFTGLFSVNYPIPSAWLWQHKVPCII